MEVILKEDVDNLGHRGDVVKVAEGYGRNFLLPRKLAMQATDANKAVIEQMKASAARRSASEKAVAEALVAKLEPVVLSFTRKSGEEGRLFGSVTSADIAAELASERLRDRSPQGATARAPQERGRLQCSHQAASRSHRAHQGEGCG